MANVLFIRARLDRYRSTVAWIVRDTLRASRRRVIIVLSLNAAGILSATGSMGLVLRYIHWAQHPHPIEFAGVVWLEKPGTLPLVVVAVISLILGIGSAALVYAGDRSLLGLVREAQTRFMRHVLDALCLPRLGAAMLAYERKLGEPPTPMDLLIAGGRYSAFALRALVQLFLPGMTFLVSLIALFTIDWKITMVLILFATLYLLPLYRINESVARHHRQYRRTNKFVPRVMRSSLSVMVGTSGPARELSRLSGDELLAGSEFQQMQASLFGRMLGAKRLVLLNSIFLVGFVVLILLAFARQETISWTGLLAYLIAIRFTWSSVRQVTALLTSFNQIFSEVEKVAMFVQLAEARGGAESVGAPNAGDAPDIELANAGRHQKQLGADGRVTLAPGSVVLVLDARSIDRTAIERALALLASKAERGGERLAGVVVHDNPRLANGLTIAQHVVGNRTLAPHEHAMLRSVLEEADLGSRLDALPKGLETRIDGDLSLPRNLRYLIGAAYLLLDPPPLVALNLRPLSEADAAGRIALVRRLSDSVLFLVDQDASAWHDAEEIRRATTHVAVLLDREEAVIGGVDWYLSRRGELDAQLASIAAARGVNVADNDDVEELSDDE